MRTFLAALVVLPYDQRVAIRWGEIQAYAQLRGRPRPANDSWIAACCLAREQPLATFNIKDYIDFVEHDAVGAGPNTRVLDVACGQGYLAARAVERGATAVGIDIAEPMIKIARQRFPRAEFRQGDAQALPFADRCFDTVVGNLALPHFGRPEQAAAEFRRVLTAGGRLALTAWNHPARARLVGVLLEAVHEVGIGPPATVPAGPNFFRFAEDTELKSLLKNQDFGDIDIRTVEFVHRVDNVDELWDGLLHGTVRTSAVIRGQPDDVVRQIRAEFDRRVNDYKTGEKYALPVSFKLASARRS